MSRVLRTTALGDARPLDVRDGVPDARTRELVERARAEAFAAGRRDGAAEARAEAARASEAAIRALVDAHHQIVALLREQHDTRTAASTELALEIARVVLAREPATGDDVVARVRRALADLDDPEPVLHVHPDVAPLLEPLRLEHPDLRVEPDPTTDPAAPRLVGRFARADLGVDAALAHVRELLQEVAA